MPWTVYNSDGKVLQSAEVGNNSITNAKMADDAVDSAEIVDGAVDLAHMSVNSIDSDQYVDGSIDLAHMSVNSIDSDQYVDGSIDLAHMSVNSIDSDQYVDASIDTAHIGNLQITNALMADDAVGVAELSATGTASSSTFLRGDNAWTAAGGGAMTLIESINITSSTGDLNIDGLDSSVYDSYLVILSQMVPTAQPYAVLELGDSSGIRDSSGSYNWHHWAIRANSSTPIHTNFVGGSEGAYILMERRGTGTATGQGFSANVWIQSRQTGDSTQRVRVHGTWAAETYLSETEGGVFIAATTAAMDLTQVQFSFAGADTESGRMTLYGVKHT